jgi:DNA-binding transcriptional MerR regulator
MSEPSSEPPAEQTGRTGERPVYSIGAVARMLGVDVATLRAWEDRYAVVVPARSQGGQRIYSRDDLEHLRFVLRAMEDGAGAGDAHRLLGAELRISEPLQRAYEPEKTVIILLAERDRFAAELAEYLLRTEGYDVCVAFDSDDARRLQRDEAPDLVIVELMIAGGGLQLCERLSQAGDLPLLAVSALDLADKALDAGAAAFLTKPIEPLQFVSTVRDLLGQSALTRATRSVAT